MGLIPELRADRNGKLVTRHVRNSVPTASPSKLPAPAIGVKKASEPKADTKQKRHESVVIKWANADLKKAGNKRNFEVAITHFTCSDEEAYSVLSVAGYDNTLALLDAGIRSKHEALDFLAEHNLQYLEEDNTELVREAIARKMPAIQAIEAFKTFNDSRPTFFDAAEAYTIRALRDATGSGSNIPFMVQMDEISLADLKHIGAARVQKAERTMWGITNELKAIHNGTSTYDVDTLKSLIIKQEKGYSRSPTDTVRMANYYGADLILGLNHYDRAISHHEMMRKSGRSLEDKAQIIRLADEMLSSKAMISFTEVMEAHDAGVSAETLIKRLEEKLTVREIIAMESGVEASLTSGWL